MLLVMSSYGLSYSYAFALYYNISSALQINCVLFAGNDLDTYQHQLLELRQRLLYAEKENSKRSHELSSVLGEIKHIVAKRINLTTNHTGLYA
mgnify:CR=1 FL=1